MRKFVAVAVLLAVSSTPVFAYDLIVNNTSEYDIHELYVSKSKSSKWGPDQLQKQTIDAGEKFTLRNIADGIYDLKIVDEDETECIIENVEFSESKEWKLTSKIMEKCDAEN